MTYLPKLCDTFKQNIKKKKKNPTSIGLKKPVMLLVDAMASMLTIKVFSGDFKHASVTQDLYFFLGTWLCVASLPWWVFFNLSTELISGIQKEKEAGNLPSHVARGMEELYHNYKDAVVFPPPQLTLIIFLSITYVRCQLTFHTRVRLHYL